MFQPMFSIIVFLLFYFVFYFVLSCTIVCVYLLFYCVWKVQVQIDNEFYIFKTFYDFIRELISWLKQRKKINRAHSMAIFIWNFAIIKSNYFKRILEILPLNVSNIHGKHLLADGIYYFKFLLNHVLFFSSSLKCNQLFFFFMEFVSINRKKN